MTSYGSCQSVVIVLFQYATFILNLELKITIWKLIYICLSNMMHCAIWHNHAIAALDDSMNIYIIINLLNWFIVQYDNVTYFTVANMTYLIKTYIANLVRMTYFWNILHHVRSKQKYLKAKWLKNFWEQKHQKGHKQDSFNNNYMI